MSEKKDNDDSKKAATNLAFIDDDENVTQQEPQIQEPPAEEQKDTIKVPEHDALDDSGVFSPVPPDSSAAATAPTTPKPAEDGEKSDKSPTTRRLKAGAEAFIKDVRETLGKVKNALRSSSSSPKKESLTEEAKDNLRPPEKVKEEAAKKQRNPSMVSMASLETDTDPDLDSGVTEVSTLPESDTFEVAPLLSDESVDNLAQRVDKIEAGVPETDKGEDAETESDLPEADNYKASADKKGDDDKKDADKPGDNKD